MPVLDQNLSKSSAASRIPNQKRKLSPAGSSVSRKTPRLIQESTRSPETEHCPAYSSATRFTSLQSVLDLSLIKNQSELMTRFETIASTLLFESHLVVADTRMEILELEFYYYHSQWHRDPFTHGSTEQKVAGNWYFHRVPRRSQSEAQQHAVVRKTGYRGGSRKGLDLTFGQARAVPATSRYFMVAPASATSHPDSSDPSASIRGGILLRALRDSATGTVISGPSLLVDQVLKLCGAASIGDLVENVWGGDTSAFSHLSGCTTTMPRMHLASRPRSEIPMYTSPRVGLDLSPRDTVASLDNLRVSFVSKRYRYFVHPELLTSNGRAQTFLGVLHPNHNTIPDTVVATTSSVSEICIRTGWKEASVRGYLDALRSGENGDGEVKLRSFVGAKGKGLSTARYLEMMGCIAGMETRQ